MSQPIKIFQYNGNDYQEYSIYSAIQSQTANNSEYLGGIINTDYALKTYVDTISIKKSPTYTFNRSFSRNIRRGDKEYIPLTSSEGTASNQHYFVEGIVNINIYAQSAQKYHTIGLHFNLGNHGITAEAPIDGGSASNSLVYRLIGNKSGYIYPSDNSETSPWGDCYYWLPENNDPGSYIRCTVSGSYYYIDL